MPYQNLLTDLDADGILTITLNRPDKLNALSQALLDELFDVIIKAKTDPKIYSVLLTGSGKAQRSGHR